MLRATEQMSWFKELTFIEVSTFVLDVMMECSDTYPDRKIMEVSFLKGSLTQRFKMNVCPEQKS